MYVATELFLSWLLLYIAHFPNPLMPKVHPLQPLWDFILAALMDVLHQLPKNLTYLQTSLSGMLAVKSSSVAGVGQG